MIATPRRLAGLAVTLSAALLAPAAAGAEEPILNVYNWADYVGEDTIKGFERETGITVRYDYFDSNEILHAKLVAGRTGYDVVVPSSYWGKIQAAGGLLKPLDKARLPNLKNLDPAIEAALAQMDPGNAYLVPWLWGYTTVGINVDKVKAALGPLPMPENAWDLLFKPEYVSRLSRCGVSFIDAPTEVIPPALHYLGKKPYSRDLADYAEAGKLLSSIRPYVTLFSSVGYINDLANGTICVALGYSGDINIAKRRAIQARTGQRIEALIPKTGGILFVDAMAIPADAPHPENALRFIDYILRPEVHAGLTNKVFYANPNLASRPFVLREVAEDKTVFPTPEDMKRMALPDVLTNDVRRASTRLFTTFKSGI